MEEKPQKSSPTKNYRLGHRQRLRQRFLRGGADSVQEYELLELILFRAIPRRDVKELAHQLIDTFGDLSGVMSAAPSKLKAIPGIGENVIVEFKIIEAAALRFGQSRIMHQPVLRNWEALITHCRTKMAEKRIEEFHVLFLDKRNRIIADEALGIGTVDHTPVYPREVIKQALHHEASALILVHNHPSGNPAPSPADIEMTNKLRDLAGSFNIVLHDHLVIGRGDEFSFRNQGLI